MLIRLLISSACLLCVGGLKQHKKRAGAEWRVCCALLLCFCKMALLCKSLSIVIFIALFLELVSASHQLVHLSSNTDNVNSNASANPQPYRTAFHFQPAKNWMNDPNGPMFYKGYYHLFYQWNPFAAVWGNITWAHAVSKDMVHWHILNDLALVPDQWYDQYGCWSGSATILSKEKPVLLYTGWSNVSFSQDNQVQMQAMAVPADYDDPLLRKWAKIPQNPILTAPLGINSTKFRDPTTGWIGSDGKWRIIIGSKKGDRGLALLYKSSDFVHWEKAKHPLHSVPFTGMWECPDFYPIPASASRIGLDTSTNGPDVKHVLKVSLDDTKHDHYAVGTYVASTDSFIPANAKLDAGIGLRYDYGKYYASKTFYDNNKGRRILIGWVNESTSNTTDIAKGWSSLQSFPRIVWLDGENKDGLLQWPIEEVESLHKKKASLKSLYLESGLVVEVKGVKGAQLDIQVDFGLPNLKHAESMDVTANNAQLICSEKGVSRSGVVGPFGLLVLASIDQAEQTALFFYIVSSESGWKALVCSDQSRSSLATDLDKTSYGSFISISGKESALSLRVLVDHSIVETFAQGGKLCITSRVYPTKAIGQEARLFVFNNGSAPIQLQGLVAWEMETVHIDTL